MLAESWKRPSFVIAAWAAVLLGFFVVRGDLRITTADRASLPADSAGRTPRSAPGSTPEVVRVEPTTRRVENATRLCKGRVFDAMGFLVVGAEVQANDAAPTRTNADGEFQLELVEGALVELLVQAKGLQPRRLRVSVSSPDPLLVQLAPAAPWDDQPSALSAVEATLLGEGTVRTAQGAPVVGAFVTAIGFDAWTRTDEIGRYVLPLHGTRVTLLVHQEDTGGDGRGLAARTEPLDIGRTHGVVPLPEILASPAGTVRGVVRDDRGTPVEGVPMQVRGEGLARVFESGPGGIFRLGGLPAGRYTVRPFAFRGALGTPHDFVLDGPVTDCDLHLLSADERRVRLLDEHGAPVGRAYIATAFAGERNSVAQTDGEGWADLMLGVADVSDGLQFDVRAGAGHASVPVRRYDAEHATLVVSMP